MIAAGLGIYAIAIPALLLVLLAGAEIVWPRRKLELGRSPRWRTHALFFATNAVVGRLLSFLVVVGIAAHWASTQHFGAEMLRARPMRRDADDHQKRQQSPNNGIGSKEQRVRPPPWAAPELQLTARPNNLGARQQHKQ